MKASLQSKAQATYIEKLPTPHNLIWKAKPGFITLVPSLYLIQACVWTCFDTLSFKLGDLLLLASKVSGVFGIDLTQNHGYWSFETFAFSNLPLIYLLTYMRVFGIGEKTRSSQIGFLN